jgi:hypothetical protein
VGFEPPRDNSRMVGQIGSNLFHPSRGPLVAILPLGTAGLNGYARASKTTATSPGKGILTVRAHSFTARRCNNPHNTSLPACAIGAAPLLLLPPEMHLERTTSPAAMLASHQSQTKTLTGHHASTPATQKSANHKQPIPQLTASKTQKMGTSRRANHYSRDT